MTHPVERHGVTPELAALIREVDAAEAEAIATGQEVVSAALAAANARIARTKATRLATQRSVLLVLELDDDDYEIVGTEGYSDNARVLVKRKEKKAEPEVTNGES